MLVKPEVGLLFWMLLSFGIVFFVLAKWGFPVIVGMVEKRKKYIEDSLEAAKEANRQLANIKQECEDLLAEARRQQVSVLADTDNIRKRMLEEAKQQARDAGAKELKEMRRQIQIEKDDAIKELRAVIAEMSVQVAEKIIRTQLSSTEQQQELLDRLVSEAMLNY
jgi:F-type H+-transporting ATPase subunit b